jgi:hypothetical protein
VELNIESARLVARAFLVASERGFANPSSGVTAGRTEAGLHGTLGLTDALSLVVDALHSKDLLTGGRRDGGMLAVEAKLAKALKFEFGVRRAAETAQAAQVTSAGVLPFGLTAAAGGYGLQSSSDVDPISGLPVTRPGFSPQLSAGPNAAPTGPNSETTLRARLTYDPNQRATVYAEAEQDARHPSRRAAAVGAQIQVTEQNRFYARQELTSSLDGPYNLNDRSRLFGTVFGFASTVAKDSDVFSEYRIRDAVAGREAEAALGLRNQWLLARGIRLATGLERLHIVQGEGREAMAVSAGLEYTRSARLKGTGRIEWRRDPAGDSWLSTVGVAERLSKSWTLLARNFYQQSVPLLNAPRQLQNRFSVGGAYRSTDSNRLNLLTRYEYRLEKGGAIAGTVGTDRVTHAVSTHVTYQPALGWDVSGQYAAKWIDERGAEPHGPYRADLVSGRIGHDLFRRLDLGALGSLMWSPQGGRQRAMGGELGILLRTNLWLSLGNNLVGFRESDMDAINYTAHGLFTRLRFKFD